MYASFVTTFCECLFFIILLIITTKGSYIICTFRSCFLSNALQPIDIAAPFFYLLFPKNNWLVSFHEERGKVMFLIRVKPAEKVVISEQGNNCFQDNKPNVARNFRGRLISLHLFPFPFTWEAYNCLIKVMV